MGEQEGQGGAGGGMEGVVSVVRQAHSSEPCLHADCSPGAHIHHPALSMVVLRRGPTLPILQRWQLRLQELRGA